MARKKNKKSTKKDFASTPFSQLKGVSVPDPAKPNKSLDKSQQSVKKQEPKPASFYDEMAMLGVHPIDRDDEIGDEDCIDLLESEIIAEPAKKSLTGDELFLSAMQDLEVRFSEPDYDEEISQKEAPLPRRMKQLRQGRITPDASLDLHGLKCADVAPKLKFFIQDARHNGWQTLLVITGRGLHSESGEAVLRSETELVIEKLKKKEIAEWGYAPQRYGGQGAIVLFLKNKIQP